MKTGRERILDVGCARGNHFGIYNKKDATVVGIDLREDFAKWMSHKHPNHRFAVADGHELPFQPASFDQAYITSVLEHVEDPTSVLREVFNALRPGGKLVVDVPHPRYEWVMGKISPKYHAEGFHKMVFKPDQIRKLVVNTGFTVTEYSPRMWQAAAGISAMWLLAKLKGKLEYDGDSGELVGAKKKTPAKQFAHTLIWLSENKNASPKRYLLLTPLRWPNKIYPWVTYIEAHKPITAIS